MGDYVLSIYPGLDLLGRAFEMSGCTVLRGPDILWGGDNRQFHPPPGVFAGVIGGPPCQSRSQLAKFGNVRADDLIADFVRTVTEAQPQWVVMENVRGFLNHPAIPEDWFPIKLRDWDCGGFTSRTRYFWIYPADLVLAPPRRPGKPEWSVLAYSWKGHNSASKTLRMHSHLTLEKACELQGFPELKRQLEPLGVRYAISLLGNGVPKAMGLYIARAILKGGYHGRT